MQHFMKTKISLACLFTGFLISTNLGAAPAAGGGGGASGAGAAAPAVPANRIIPESPGRDTIPPGQTTPPVFPNPPTATANGTISTNSMSPGTNQLGMATNQMQGSNNSTTANDNNAASGNHAITPSDRILLSTLNQTVGAQLGVTSQNAMPVHFLIANGAVTLVGVVPTADQSQRILARVQQTPGVLSVFNDLRVGTGTAAQTANNQTSFFSPPADHAFSPADQSLLTAVQQSTGTQLGINGASTAQMPVHFSIQNGVVGVTGQVTSLQEKQVILAAVQKVQGVTRVVDNVSVVNEPAGGVNGANGNPNPSQNNNNLPATSRDLNQTNSIFLNTTNNSGM
jgi:osmotically-inducible protein OsmY